MSKIYWSPLAAQRLEIIFEYISADNNIAANKLIGNIFKKVESLVEFPAKGRKVPEVNKDEIREIFENGYRIIYRVGHKEIFILTIRNSLQLLSEKDLQ
jgi:plasmid stabilization system protein ParE